MSTSGKIMSFSNVKPMDVYPNIYLIVKQTLIKKNPSIAMSETLEYRFHQLNRHHQLVLKVI